MQHVCEHLRPVLEHLLAEGIRVNEVYPLGTAELTLETDREVAWEDVLDRMHPASCVRKWDDRDYHWPREGVLCEVHRHFIASPRRKKNKT